MILQLKCFHIYLERMFSVMCEEREQRLLIAQLFYNFLLIDVFTCGRILPKTHLHFKNIYGATVGGLETLDISYI